MSKLDFHTVRELNVRVFVFSVVNVWFNMWVDACKKLEETVHVYVRNLSQDSTFDLF